MESDYYSFIRDKVLAVSGYRDFNFQHLFLFLGLSIGALILEAMILGYEKSSIKRIFSFNDNSSKTDLISYLMDISGLIKITAAICTFGIFYKLTGWIKTQTGIDLILKVEPGLARDIIAYIIIDFFYYWRHWLMHKVPVLWNFHKFHHTAKSFNMITLHRFHILHAAYVGFFGGLVFLLIGYNHVMSYLWILVIRYIHSLLVHSQLDWGWGFIGRFIVVSPRFHRIHHSIKDEHVDKNMGNTLIFWDILFGTYSDPRESVSELGVAHDKTHQMPYVQAQLDWYRRFISYFRSSKG